MKINVLGCRGSIAVSGEEYNLHGGSTTCFLVRAGDENIIIDAGTGLPLLGSVVLDCKKASLIITHLHLDHILGMVMCPEFFREDFTLSLRAPCESAEVFNRVFSPPFWPLGLETLQCALEYKKMEREFTIGDVKVRTMEGCHPGGITIVSVEHGGKKVVFASDNTISPQLEPALAEFCRGADLFISDGMYTESEWAGREEFGHTTMEKSAQFGARLGIPTLITHHDPNRTDNDLNNITLPGQCSFAKQGEEITL